MIGSPDIYKRKSDSYGITRKDLNVQWPHSFTASPFHTLDTEIAKFLNFTGTEETCVETAMKAMLAAVRSLPYLKVAG